MRRRLPDRSVLLRALRGVLPAVIGGAAGIATVFWFSSDEPAPPPPTSASAPATRPDSRPLPPQSRTEPVLPPRQVAPPPPRTAGQRVLAPRIAPAWRRYAAASAPVAGRPRIAVVIDDMGVDRRRSARAVALPGPLTLAFLPYANELPAQTRIAHAAGHELMVHVPMEPELAALDPGPTVLRAKDTDQDIDRKMGWALGRFEGFVGVNNHMGSRFTADAAGMAALMGILNRKGLLFLDSRTSVKSVGLTAALQAGVPAAARDVFLDNDDNARGVADRLKEVEAVARRNGVAIAIGHPRDATLNQLAAWLPTLQDKGFALVPVSAVVKPPR
jgi:hypothetical protein